ncbi:hypothetical protein EIP86_004269 [Pleurotus ostreatoroseus]|nr:hypothetical protein EIP86_004269 [Pleurotus ostreatoroseus]
MHILGKLLRDNQPVKHALTAFFGVGQHTAARLCARMQVHDTCKVRHLTPLQVTSLTAFLSSPTTAAPAPYHALAAPAFRAPGPRAQPVPAPARRRAHADPRDPLLGMKIEAELRREVRENIAHQRMIGSYVGRRHAMGLPVRGQNTQSNARTARKLNRIDRRV